MPHSASGAIPGSSSKTPTCQQSFSPEPAKPVLLPGTHLCTKTRKPDFSPQEMEVLVPRVVCHHPLLFGAPRGAPARELQVWRRVLQAVNSATAAPDLSNLKHKWRDLRGAVCKKLGKSSIPGLVLTSIERW